MEYSLNLVILIGNGTFHAPMIVNQTVTCLWQIHFTNRKAKCFSRDLLINSYERILVLVYFMSKSFILIVSRKYTYIYFTLDIPNNFCLAPVSFFPVPLQYTPISCAWSLNPKCSFLLCKLFLYFCIAYKKLRKNSGKSVAVLTKVI